MFSLSSDADAASRWRSSSRAVHWLEMGDHQPRAQPLGLAAVALDMRGRPFIGLDRPGEFLLDARAEHLDRDLAALGRDARGGPARSRRRRPALRRTRRTGFRAARRSDVSIVALDRGERARAAGRPGAASRFSAASLADEVGAGRQRLAELDRGRADRLQRRGIIGHRRDAARRTGRSAPAGAPDGGVSGSSLDPAAARRGAPASGPISAAATDG